MESIDDIVKINELYDLYKNLLTDKQKEYFERFYFLNMSLSEIADEFNVSRAAVHSQLKIVKDELLKFDNQLHLSNHSLMVEELRSLNSEAVNKIIDKYEEN